MNFLKFFEILKFKNFKYY